MCAQELRTLFFRAYPQAQQGVPETERMACLMLANQFAAGLRKEIRVKVAGIEGNFEKLLQIAKFEEAKLRDVVNSVAGMNSRGSTSFIKYPDQHAHDRAIQPNAIVIQPYAGTQKRCYNCNATGHLSRNCPLRGRAAPQPKVESIPMKPMALR